MESRVSLPRFTRIACYGLVIDSENRILLCRIASGLADAGMWTLPGGGVEFGENLEAAAAREVFEETGLVVSLAGIADAHSEQFVYADKELFAVRILFWTTVVGGELRDEVEGSTDKCAFFTLEELGQTLIVELVVRTLGLVRQRLEARVK